MIKLHDGDQVKVASEKYPTEIIIGTANRTDHRVDEDFNMKTFAEWEASCGRDYKRQYAYGLASSTCITSDYPGKADAHAAKQKRYDDAVIINDGDMVEIDGMVFEAHINQGHVSTKIGFEMQVELSKEEQEIETLEDIAKRINRARCLIQSMTYYAKHPERKHLEPKDSPADRLSDIMLDIIGDLKTL